MQYQGQMNASIGASQCSAQERDVGEIERAHQRLKESIRHLDQRLNTLEDRLGPVRAAVPHGEAACQAYITPSSPLAASLHEDDLDIQDIISRVSGVLDELALP